MFICLGSWVLAFFAFLTGLCSCQYVARVVPSNIIVLPFSCFLRCCIKICTGDFLAIIYCFPVCIVGLHSIRRDGLVSYGLTVLSQTAFNDATLSLLSHTSLPPKETESKPRATIDIDKVIVVLTIIIPCKTLV